VQQYQWSIQGKAVAGYQHDSVGKVINFADLSPNPTTTSEVHFYWLDGGPPGGSAKTWVSCSGNFEGVPFSVSTAFAVWTPGTQLFTATVNPNGPRIEPTPTGISIVRLDDPAHPGVAFVAGVTLPAVGAGSIQFAQVTHIIGWKNMTDGVHEYALYSKSLDGGMPMGGAKTQQNGGRLVSMPLSDNPFFNLLGVSTIGFSQASDTYLMYQPDGDGIPVPLQVAHWNWYAFAHRKADGTYSLDGHDAKASAATDTSDEPTWVGTVENGTIQWYSIP
jgi:hypothetical protein